MSETSKLQELEYGDVKIANDVVAIIAKLSASEIPGVIELKGGIASDIVGVFNKKQNTSGVKVDNDDNSVELNLSIVVEFGCKIPDVSWRIQESVKNAIESMTDLTVKVVNVHVVGIQEVASGQTDE